MSILSDRAILQALTRKELLIDPFDRDCLGSNSYDVHLGNTLAIYTDNHLDCKTINEIEYIGMSEEHGYLLMPNRLYLGVTKEYTETSNRYVPNIDGKSSVGRLGIFIHVTAGRGDAGFAGFWTLEIVVVQPIKIYPDMPIAQLTYEKINGPVEQSYNKKDSAKYANKEQRPMPSMMYKNWHRDTNTWS